MLGSHHPDSTTLISCRFRRIPHYKKQNGIASKDARELAVAACVPALMQLLKRGVSIASQQLAAFTSEPSSKSGPFFLAYPFNPVNALTMI